MERLYRLPDDEEVVKDPQEEGDEKIGFPKPPPPKK